MFVLLSNIPINSCLVVSRQSHSRFFILTMLWGVNFSTPVGLELRTYIFGALRLSTRPLQRAPQHVTLEIITGMLNRTLLSIVEL